MALLAWFTSSDARAGGRSVSEPAIEQCFEFQAARFGLDASLLRSIAVVESGLRPGVDNNDHLPRTGTRDIGLMQINTGWLPVLRQHGIGLRELRDPCTNIEVGAWILGDLVRRHGNSWDAVGAYNAACTQLKGGACRRARSAYAWKVWRSQQRDALRAPGETPSAARGLPAVQFAPTTPARSMRPTDPGLVSINALSQVARVDSSSLPPGHQEASQ
ncbi:lytic transglycosylase domain-containing protein [Ideonella sp. 4Y11]|uniref:Lytic transglycosylase domain-containing protein n=1 Tax=Ideonella aquatica TaxID=2824119 RepID=A0A941BNA3_9BURK|nr:lytic transglycosylase domain-containing protein [Ideonella aquatica]